MVSIRCAIATSAFFFPLRAANDQYFAAKRWFLHRDKAQAASHNADLICGFPFVVRVLFRFPALSWFPGATPAHEAGCWDVGNCPISTPISAIITAAVSFLTPGMVTRSSISCLYTCKSWSIRSSMSRSKLSNDSMCFHDWRIMNSWWLVNVPKRESWICCFFPLHTPVNASIDFGFFDVSLFH